MQLVFVLGPTCSGKSQMAVDLATKLDGWVMGCDSRQVYKGLDIATGKVEGRWQNGVYMYQSIPHYLIDFVEPSQKYSIKEYQQDFEKILTKIKAGNKPPKYLIVCGGTSFWAKVVAGYQSIPETKVENEFDYNKLKTSLQNLSLASLQNIYLSLNNGQKLNQSDSHNPHRLQSYILNYEAGRQNWLVGVPKIKGDKPVVLAISTNQNLNQKIENRVKARFEAGMLGEVQKQLYLGYSRLCELGLEYRLVYLYLMGFCNQQELLKKMVLENQRLAKRQLSYLRAWKEVVWIQNTEQAMQEIIKN